MYNAAREGAQANRTVVEARRLALNGVIEERNVGQRTTLDVLNAQADVIQAQIDLASDEHDIVVNSYAIINAIGRLDAKSLGLNVAVYKPEEHYEAVKDKWFGLRTPDGR
jgi:outer membrane protein